MASVSLRRTQSSGNRQKWTYSAWIKRTGIGVLGSLIGSSSTNDDDGYGQIRFQADDTLNYTAWSGEWFTTNRKFRDPNAWYHVVVRVDTTQGNVTHRIRLYINGVEETSFSSSMNPSSGQNLSLNNNSYYVYLGAECYSSGTSRFFDGVISHIHFLDGEDRTPDFFGETDSTTGEWKIKTNVTGVNYGTNGFYILKDGNSLTDQSGQSNNFTLQAGTLTKTEDCPSNVFATLNPLDVTADDEGTYSNGNTTASGDGSFHQFRSTFYLTTGKYYWEFKPTTVGDACQGGVVGSNYAGGSGLRRNYSKNGQKYTDGSASSYGATYTANDIIGVALNLDDGELTFYKNGVSQGVAYTDMLSAIGQDGWTPDLILYNSTVNINFGNGYFGTTAVSSAGTNASNNGIFEYDVPTGYTALSTKGLNI